MSQKYCKKVNFMGCVMVHWTKCGRRLNMDWMSSKELWVWWTNNKIHKNTFLMRLLRCLKTMYHLILISKSKLQYLSLLITVKMKRQREWQNVVFVVLWKRTNKKMSLKLKWKKLLLRVPNCKRAKYNIKWE